MARTMHMLIGLPGSGKSTLARRWFRANRRVVSADHGYSGWPGLLRDIKRALQSGESFVYDACNVKYQQRQWLINLAYQHGYCVHGVFVDTDIPTCVAARTQARVQNYLLDFVRPKPTEFARLTAIKRA